MQLLEKQITFIGDREAIGGGIWLRKSLGISVAKCSVEVATSFAK